MVCWLHENEGLSEFLRSDFPASTISEVSQRVVTGVYKGMSQDLVKSGTISHLEITKIIPKGVFVRCLNDLSKKVG